MRGISTFLSACTLICVTRAIPAEAPWAAIANTTPEKDKAVAHDISPAVTTTVASTTASTKPTYSASVSCVTALGPGSSAIPEISCTTYHGSEEQITTTSTASDSICTPVYEDVEYCHPPTVTDVPVCDDSSCTIPSTYVAQQDVPMEYSVASNAYKDYAPWLLGANFESSILRAPTGKLVGAMFVLKWQKYIFTQYEALNTTAYQFQGQSFYKLNIDEDAVIDRTIQYQISASPTYVFWRNGTEVGRLVGSVGTTQLMNKVRSLLN